LQLIELTGIPGSGKSTILPLIKQYFTKLGIETYDKLDVIVNCKEFPFNGLLFQKFFNLFPQKTKKNFYGLLNRILNLREIYSTEYILNNTTLHNFIIENINNCPVSSSHKYLMFRWWISLISIYQMGINYLPNKNILILEEGFFHKIINFYVFQFDKLNYRDIELYIEKIPAPNHLFYIEADKNLCLKRLNNRKLPKILQNASEKMIVEYLDRSERVIQYALDLINARGTAVTNIQNSSESFFEKSILSQLSNII